MRKRSRLLISLALGAAIALMLPAIAQAQVPVVDENFEFTDNLVPMGISERTVPLEGAGSGIYNSDLAFWGTAAYQGTYEGFRVVNVRFPRQPREIINYDQCVQDTTTGNQGDLVVYENVLTRSWNSPTPTGGRFCGEVFTPAGEEGLHIFDITKPHEPEAVAFVPLPCGSHTATGVPDPANDRLLVYSSSSADTAGCRGIDIVEVPLDDPAAASYLRFESSGETDGQFPFVFTVDAPSSAAGSYDATGANFGTPAHVGGIHAPIALVNDGTALPNEGCNPLVGFPVGAIALVDRGTCPFVQKAQMAQAAGAIAMIVANNAPGDPITLGGTDPTIAIPSGMVSQADGAAIKAGLPAIGTYAGLAMPAHACHDTGAYLADVLRATCAGHDGVTTWSMDAADGGSLEDPAFQYAKAFEGVTIGHSAAYSWDGEVIVFGHEPGGGGQAQCQATSPDVNKTLWFLDADTGDTLGTILHPRPQGPTENCTWHNYNVVPTDDARILVSGNYQSGISVLDFTDPAHVREIAYADPAPLINPDNPAAIEGGGDWSSYWYDGRIYESDMTRGLLIWNLIDPAVAGAKKLGHLNPQTQEFTIPLKSG